MTDKRHRILVVDDDLDTCENLQDILTDLGHEVDIAQDGHTALDMIGRKIYDVALLDLKMPGMDGLTLYREIRQRCAETVAMIVTAYASGSTAQAALEAGAWQILPKPVDFSKLLPLVDEAVRQPLVMVVDDDHPLCQNLWEILRDKGYRVCLSHTSQQAAERLAQRQYEVVLIDMKLPDGDGRAVLEAVRQATPQARTVLITGFRDEMEALVEQALQDGADSVCYKPFDMGQLLETMRQLLQGR